MKRHLDLDILTENGKYSITISGPEVKDRVTLYYKTDKINDETFYTLVEEIRGWVIATVEEDK